MSNVATHNGHGDVDQTPVVQDHRTEVPDLMDLYHGAATLSHATRDDLFRESLALYRLLKELDGASPLATAAAVNDFLMELDERVVPKNRKEVRTRLNDWAQALFDTPQEAHRYTILSWVTLAKEARANALERRTSAKG